MSYQRNEKVWWWDRRHKYVYH